ncbi:NADH dehydrogenase, alpha subcomplex, subunit 6 [Lipomyces arxii]|uniref:NADH dehydrogenase, alpha subcomplex, subunit 6 n=1 Tax=Lipomyces arxii TaxID=56418 RepID=UPI0034CD72B6
MPTKPTNYAIPTRNFTDAALAREASIHLYRHFLRGVPTIVRLYQMDVPLALVRSKIRQEFERQRFVESMPVRSILLAKGQMEYQETMNFWKQKAHVFKYLSQEEYPERYVRKGFMDKFLDGTV